MSHPITFLLGAGASYPYGIPKMAGFYKDFRDYVGVRYPRHFELLQKFEQEGRHADPDLETLLSDLQSVLGVASGLSLLQADLTAVTDQLQIARELRGYLDAFVVDTCERFDRDKSARELKSLLDLRQVAPVWLFTTNYDRLIESACDQHSVSYTDGFESQVSQPVADWTGRFGTDIRIAKLHGSVNWYVDDPAGALHRLDRGYSLPAHDFRLVRGDQVLRPLMIIPTLEKEALGEPYIQLAMKFTDVLAETKLLIVAGNSLRDKHIRNYIQGRLDTLHVLLVGPRATQKVNVFGRPDKTHALDAGFSEFLTLGGQALRSLMEDLLHMEESDDVLQNRVQQFMDQTVRNLDDEAILSTNPELARLVQQAREGSIAARSVAVDSLGDHPHPAVIRVLTSVLETATESPVRVSAVSSLVRLGGTEVIESIGQILIRDVSQDVQMESALALAQLRSSNAAIEWLKRANERRDVNPAVRTVISEILNGSGTAS